MWSLLASGGVAALMGAGLILRGLDTWNEAQAMIGAGVAGAGVGLMTVAALLLLL